MTSKRIDDNDSAWQADAWKAMAELMVLYAERSNLESRIEQARQKCARAGCSFRFDREMPELHSGNVWRCACGAVFGFRYGDTVPENPVCPICVEKTRAALEQDQKASLEVTGPESVL